MKLKGSIKEKISYLQICFFNVAKNLAFFTDYVFINVKKNKINE